MMIGFCVLSIVGCSGGTPSTPIEKISGANATTNAEDGGLAELAGEVEIDGSSTVYPISEAAATAFKDELPKVSVTVGISGTGGGFKRFTKGDTDISDASRPIKLSEFEQCRKSKVSFIELPVAYDGLTIVVNPKNDWVDQLSVDELKRIFRAQGPAKTWSEVRDGWPPAPIKIYAPGADSGTFDYFKEVVAGEGAVRADMSTSEDDNVLVTGVAGEKNAIGFFGAAYFFENKDKLKAVKIVNPESKTAVAPTAETIESGEYAPFSRPLFIYVNVDSLRRPEMKKFVEFYLSNAGPMAEKTGYVALPKAVYETVREHYDLRLTGTHFWTADGEKRTGALPALYTKDKRLEL